jgi:hypothetical protein
LEFDIPETVMDSASAVYDWRVEGQDVVFHRDLTGGWDGSMQAHSLTNNHVKIRKCG